jgi:hypothetical protein
MLQSPGIASANKRESAERHLQQEGEHADQQPEEREEREQLMPLGVQLHRFDAEEIVEQPRADGAQPDHQREVLEIGRLAQDAQRGELRHRDGLGAARRTAGFRGRHLRRRARLSRAQAAPHADGAQDGEDRKHAPHFDQRCGPPGQHSAEYSSERPGARDPSDRAFAGVRIEPLVDVGPEGGDHRGAEERAVQVDGQGGHPREGIGEAPDRQQQPSAHPEDGRHHASGRMLQHHLREPERREDGEQRGDRHHGRQGGDVEADQIERVAGRLAGDLLGDHRPRSDRDDDGAGRKRRLCGCHWMGEG